MSACKNVPEAQTFAIYSNILTEAFQTDVEDFLLLFRQRPSSTFANFAEIWKETNFSFVFSRQRYYFLLQQFTDNCFFVVMKFILFPNDIHTQVGAIYLLYSLYFKQLVKNWVKIRITQEEHEKFKGIVKELRDREHLEPLYCYNKLLVSNAFQYVFLKKTLAPENQYLKTFKEPVNDIFKSVRISNSYAILKQKLNEDNFLERLTQVSAKYDKALAEFAVNDPATEISEFSIIDEIESTLKCDESMDPPEETNIDQEDSVHSGKQQKKNLATKPKPKRKCRMMGIEDENFDDY